VERVTIKDIAKESGVSTASVSRVLNETGNVSEKVQKRVLDAVKKLNYQPNAVARSLKLQRTNTIGVILPDIANSYFMRISKGIESVIGKKKYTLLFASSDENPEKEKKLLQTFVEKRVDAIVVATAGHNDQRILNINHYGIPIILMDRELTNKTKSLSFVGENNVKSAYDLTNYILNHGHTRIGVINGNLEVTTGFERFQGFVKATTEKKIFQDKNLIYNGNFTENDGTKAVKKFMSLEEKPTAILSFNNTMTYGAILELVKLNISIPNDIFIASFGKTNLERVLDDWKITYIQQRPYEMGIQIGEILMNKLNGNSFENKEYIFELEIVKSNS